MGYGEFYPVGSGARWVVVAHVAASILLSVVILTRILSNLPRSRSLDTRENDDLD